MLANNIRFSFKMQESRFEINTYVVLFLTCEVFDVTIASGLVQSLFRNVIFVWSLIYYVKILINYPKEPAIIKTLSIFYLSLAIYGIILVVEGKALQVGIRNVINMSTLNYIYKVSWSLLPIFVFYNFARRGVLNKSFIMNWLKVFIVVVAICYLLMLQNSVLKNDGEVGTNNAGYLVVSLIPMFIFLRNRSWLQYFLIASALFLVFLSMKRGAILAGFMAAGVYLLYLFRKAKRSTLVGLVIALVIGVWGTFELFERMMATSSFFQERVDDTLEGDTNGREWIYSFFIDEYMNNYSLQEKLIGRGANSTLEIMNMFAHNDWIELGINQGLLGMALYLFFWIAFVRLLLKKDVPPEVKTSLIMIFVIYFLKTWFSMSYSGYTLYSSMTFGYCIAMSYQRIDKKRIASLKSR